MKAGANTHPLPAERRALVLDESSLPWLLGIFGAIWLLFLAWCALTPPVDDIEQLIWVQSLEWGYFKHPPLPTWILGFASVFFPVGPPLVYFLGACCILGAHAVFWSVLRQMHGPRVATVLLLASLCITFYNQRLHYFNHNVVMMPAVAVCFAMLWRLTRLAGQPGRERAILCTWAAVGVAMGLGMLAKYQMALAGICLGLWWLYMGWWREKLHRRGFLLATLIGTAIFLPHLLWLVQHDWLPLRYAEETSLGVALEPLPRISRSMLWALDWMLNRSLPAWLVIGATVAWTLRRANRSVSVDSVETHSRPAEWRAICLLWGLFPLLCMTALGLLLGVDLQKHWGTAFALWTLTALPALAPRVLLYLDSSTAVRAAWGAFGVVQVLIIVHFGLTSPRGPEKYSTGHWQHYPSQELADRLGPVARQALGGPIDIIAGRTAIAGALALRLPERPKVLINGDLRTSPWIAEEELRQARVIEVVPALELPPGGQWLGMGFAWRVGYSSLARLQYEDLSRVSATSQEGASGGR